MWSSTNLVQGEEGTAMAHTTVDGVEGVQSLVGQHLGHSDWVTITQEQVNQFADATGDHQWIHVDVERATRESPFGGPIAHGYLTLSLTPLFLPQLIDVNGFSLGVTPGGERLRFPPPVRVGGRSRARSVVNEPTVVSGGFQLQITLTFE